MAVSRSRNNAKVFNRPVSATRFFATGGPVSLARITTAQRDLMTPTNGDMIYNTTTNKGQLYQNGAWVDLV